MRNKRLYSPLLAAVLVAAAASAHAATEFKYDTGPCKGGGSWYSVTQYDNGRPVRMWGRGCNNLFYEHDICYPYNILPIDPVSGNPTHQGFCADGLAGWYSEIIYSSDYTPIAIRGRNCEGQFYECMNIGDKDQGNLQ